MLDRTIATAALTTRLRANRYFTVLCCAFLLQACANPPYKFKMGEPTARLKVLFDTAVSICDNGKWFDIKKTSQNDYISIPAGKRVLLSTFGYYPEYGVTYSCLPRVGFKPEENILYYTDYNIINNRCVLEVARENASSRTGLERETSVGPTSCAAANK